MIINLIGPLLVLWTAWLALAAATDEFTAWPMVLVASLTYLYGYLVGRHEQT